MNKKIVSIFTIIILSFFTMSTVFAYNSGYKDVKSSDWFNKYVTFVSTYNIMGGDKNGHFNPKAQITKADLAETMYNFNSYIGNTQATINSEVSTEIDTKIKDQNESTKKEISKMIDQKLANVENDEQKTIKLITNSMSSIVQIEVGDVTGTGFFISDNQILTDYHVINNQGTIKVSTVTGQEYDVKVIKSDANKDLALLEIVGDNKFNYLQFTNDKLLGENVLILGNPEGISFAVSKGIISRLDLFDTNKYMNLIQVDAAVNPGNSGSPLIDDKGKVIGIVESKYAGEDIDNIGFAISYETIQQFLYSE